MFQLFEASSLPLDCPSWTIPCPSHRSTRLWLGASRPHCRSIIRFLVASKRRSVPIKSRSIYSPQALPPLRSFSWPVSTPFTGCDLPLDPPFHSRERTILFFIRRPQDFRCISVRLDGGAL
ncbi:hypothetical protein BDQ94DRAFT_143443 [Aspergillus welwitschiae]|uniref:Uncharacterized protein n=1 Tax=Aspergillus welwitschiae TaxID=1341132 RepID=A0A3F3Q367_9EURO|nr:hypothetical protein BDQ94DRAFT_143443 [Aspergillus welwitschiae]RDH33618.1 hypothetical protein BDQ94DRAFT_143443 [Aspergillus welwitschiae]